MAVTEGTVVAKESAMSGEMPAEPATKQSGTRLAWRMLNGMLSSVRCQDFLEKGELDYARVELLALHQALAEVENIDLDEAGCKDRCLLRDRATDLGACLQRMQSRRSVG
jgi:hypothetical protein